MILSNKEYIKDLKVNDTKQVHFQTRNHNHNKLCTIYSNYQIVNRTKHDSITAITEIIRQIT